ncbi:hypothetical protein JTB14_031431 [Gonioctena quinquepunctata]|nr:hypothetical protein JTB14_031431 [Gonioctena quinquepunctata]
MVISQFNSPFKELPIDEPLLYFHGRLQFRVFIQHTTSDGYLLNKELYSGPVRDVDGVDNTKTEAIDMRLMKPYLMKGHECFMGNYYDSYELSEKMMRFKTHANGTLR